MKKLIVLGLSLSTLILVACHHLVGKNSELSIVTTFYPVYEFTKQIVGGTADVELLVEAGTEPHDYEPSAKDIATIQEADAFVYENENMETWVSKLDSKKVTAIKATKGMILLPSEGHSHEENNEDHYHAYDPHVWLSPKRAIKMVESIRDQLSKQFPDKKTIFEKNAASYIKKLASLNKKYEEVLSQAKQKAFVTQHTAFAYLALDYGLKQVGITGISADTEPTATRLATLSRYVKDNDIKYIYFEENASKKVAETLAKETGAKTAVLNPLESLTKEEMKKGRDYISVMEENLKSLGKTTSQSGSEIKPETTDKTAKTVYNGYFADKDIKNRTLSDYAGKWQSVYPLLKDGSLDQVFDYKAKLKGDKTAEEYKAYYDTGYKSDISHITIKGNTIEFIVNKEAEKHTYKYVGYKILNYKKGNRGVRYLFEATDKNPGKFKYVQFSDHNIAPSKAFHFHIFYGDTSQDEILKELDNWPTFYPSDKSGFDIAQEMVAH